MNPLVIVVPVVVVLAAVVLFAASRRRDTSEAIGALSRETRKRDRGEPEVLEQSEVAVPGRVVERQAVLERRPPELATVGGSDLSGYVPPDDDAIGVTRRQFFNRSIVLLMGLSLSGFGAAVLAFLWPRQTGGFGSAIRVGEISDIQANIAANNGFLYLAEGRMWITAYPSSGLERAASVYPPSMTAGLEAGVIALYQQCPHLGCRVPECETSQWFECPCHGSQYNKAGERMGGPAPRGMDHFAMDVTGGVLTVDTGTIIQGPPLGTDTIGQQAEGPHCVGAVSH